MVKVESEKSSREADPDAGQKACCSRWWNKLFGDQEKVNLKAGNWVDLNNRRIPLDKILRIQMACRFSAVAYADEEQIRTIHNELFKTDGASESKIEKKQKRKTVNPATHQRLINIRKAFSRFCHIEYEYIRHKPSKADAYICYAIEKKIPGCLRPPRRMIILSIRGTDEVGDMAIDMKMWKTKFDSENNEVKVHAGFNQQFIGLKKQVSEFIEKIKSEKEIDEILLTGHSLGGSVSALFGCYLGRIYPDLKINVESFGSPKPGNELFKNLFQTRVNEHLRVVMPNDPVPKSMKTFTHTCDKGSSQHFICYDPSRSFMSHTINTYIEGIMETRKDIFRKRFANLAAKAKHFLIFLDTTMISNENRKSYYALVNRNQGGEENNIS